MSTNYSFGRDRPPPLQDGENQPEQETGHQGENRQISTVGRQWAKEVADLPETQKS